MLELLCSPAYVNSFPPAGADSNFPKSREERCSCYLKANKLGREPKNLSTDISALIVFYVQNPKDTCLRQC